MRATTIFNRTSRQPLTIGGNAYNSVLKTLAYFDIFHYPLTEQEIRIFSATPIPEAKIGMLLQELIKDKRIFHYQGFYSLQNNPLLVHRRVQGNKRATVLLSRAAKIGRFLYRFPFVKAVAISGSLSKNFADEKSDIDFFVITKTNRLWIARTIMHLFKKLTFLRGRQHFYCMNYYISEENLVVAEQNIFTAVEIKTLIPVCGGQVMQRFFETNDWTNKWLPACPLQQQKEKDKRSFHFKDFFEGLINKAGGDHLDDYLMNVTAKRWKRKEQKGKRNARGQSMELITGKHQAYSNPGAFQEKVLALYEEKISLLIGY